MTYIVVQFDYPNKNRTYEKLLKVFRQSVKENDPDSDIIERIVSPPQIKNNHSFSSNTHKLGIWVEEMMKLPEGHEICFIDCDMMVLKPCDDIWEKDFDIAYTKRPVPQGHRLPVNGGVVFCRNNERSRQFMRKWQEVNDKMYHNQRFHQQWRKKYAGMNQSAFGYLMEHPKEYTAKLLGVECNTYNVCNESWHRVGHDKNMRIVHIKSALRKQCVSGKCYDPKLKQVVKMWIDFYCKTGEGKIDLLMTPKSLTANKTMSSKRQPIPGKTKRQNKVKVNMGVADDENVHCLIGRQVQRRLYVP